MSFSSDKPLMSNQLPISLELPELDEPKLFVEQTELFLKRIANILNTKVGSLYQLQELASFEIYNTTFNADGSPNNRNVYRTLVNFGALPNATTKSVAHGVNFETSFRATRILGSATDPVNRLYIPIPFSSPTLNENIKITVDATNVNITTGINYSAYTYCTIILEYTKATP